MQSPVKEKKAVASKISTITPIKTTDKTQTNSTAKPRIKSAIPAAIKPNAKSKTPVKSQKEKLGIDINMTAAVAGPNTTDRKRNWN